MSRDTDYIVSLIEYTVAEDNERVDLEACLEIADRANSNKAECLEVIRSLTKCLGKSNPKIVVNTLQLLETLCKNCNMRFLYELNNKKLVDALLKVVVRRRDRAKYGTKASKTANPIKIEGEEKVLFLIQLWADTFMMHQTEFRNIHDAYRNLRKDGVQFPERDKNQKVIINFQGQTSPVFLAMEGDYIVPSNNQGGPMTEPGKKSQQSFKPKPVEYKHEYNPSQVQNTLYDENDDDESEYNPRDGIQITREEVKILEESIGILKEIERTATTSADMKGEIAKEILGDLVHVHKRLKRFLKTEKFASASQKNEAIRLSQVLSNCLSSYKTKYYKLKEEQKRRIRTEPDEDFRGKFQEDLPQKNFGRLATEYDETNYADKIKLSQDLVSDPKKRAEMQKPVQNKKFEPPSGWKNTLEIDKNLNGNPDLIDLLNNREAAAKSHRQTTAPKIEERKEERMKTQGAQDLVNDLLDINFNTEPVQNISGTKPSKENKKFASPQGKFQIAAPKFASPVNNPAKNPVNFFDFSDYPATTTSNQPNATGQAQAQTNAQNLTSTKATSNNDDDDFFNDIANRKK